MRRAPRFLLVAALVGTFSACHSCQDSGPGNLFDVPAADTPGAVWLPNTAALGEHILAFVNRATRKAGGAVVRRVQEGIVKQLGFDAFDPEAYGKVGLDPKAGAIVFMEGKSREPLLALGIADRKVFDAAITEMVARTDGADKIASTTFQGRNVHTAGRPFGSEVAPALHWAHVGKYALLARPEGMSTLEAALTRLAAGQKSPTLAQDAVYLSVKDHVPAADGSIFVRSAGAQGISAGALTSFKLDQNGASADTFIGLATPDLSTALSKIPTLPLAGRVEADAVALLLGRAMKPDGVALLRKHAPTAALIDQALLPLRQAIGIDVEKDILPLLAGPITASVHVASVHDLPQKIKERSVPALLDVLHVVATCELADAAAMRALLVSSQADLAKRGVAIRQRVAQFGGAPATIFEPDKANTRLGWAVWKSSYVYAAGEGRLEHALQRLAAGDSELPQRLGNTVTGEAAKKPGVVLAVRFGALADAAANIALSDNPGAKVGLAALVGSLLEVLRTLGDVALSIAAEGDGLRVTVREVMQ